MDTLPQILKKELECALTSAFPFLGQELASIDVVPCHEEGFGHYQTNSALKLGKALSQSPRVIAEAVLENVSDGCRTICSQIEIAGPGFINMTLSPAFISEQVNKIAADPHFGALVPEKSSRVVVDFSSPNVAKELHVGHIRSTIIGDCLARLFEFLGFDVVRLNHIGDWGTQFGMLIAYMKEHVPGVISGSETADLSALMGWYKSAKKLFDQDEKFKGRAQQQVVQLQAHDSETLRVWKMICAISRKAFQEIYDLLDIRIIERGESFYNSMLADVVADLEKKGLVEISDGAKCVFMDGFVGRDGERLPLIIQKSDGGYNYDTTDLAALRHRVRDEKATRVIYVVDSGQSLHFQMVFRAAELANWVDTSKVKLEHVGFGLVLGPDGKKFKTRSGETERLIDLLMGAIDKAAEMIRERLPDANLEEVDHLAHVIGIDAIKYADLSCHRLKDYAFSYERMLRFEGNTAVFLLYAYVRLESILRKMESKRKTGHESMKVTLEHPSEIALGLHLRRFSETLELVARDLLPNRLTDYLYSLAELFNAFYRDCHVEGSPEEESRSRLCQITKEILGKGLNILGLKTVSRM